MKKPLVIFGLQDTGELAHYYFTNDTDRNVAAFTLDDAYIDTEEFCGLPVVPYERIESRYPPEDYDLFVALGYSGVNRLRREKFLSAKAKGYALASYVSSRATVLNDGKIGDNCFIFEDNTIQPFVTIGDNVTLWSGNHIGHHAVIHDHCFIASHVVVSGRVVIDESCFLGVNATLRDHIRIGAESVIGAGTLVLHDVEPGGVYIGPETERAGIPSSKLKKI